MKKYDTRRFDLAAALLPFPLRLAAENLPAVVKDRAEEIRLRLGQKPRVLLPEGESEIPGTGLLTSTDLAAVMEIATRASVHAAMDAIRSAYVTTQGGFRVGICGSAAMQEGEIRGFRAVSSMNIRIARQIFGLADRVLPYITEKGKVLDTLILSPPGGGKTTLLRDMIRCVSAGEGCGPARVSVADERGEIAALSAGLPQMDVGPCTDVLDGAPKAKAAMLLLRAMNPQVLAMDEISAPADIEALRIAANCGVTLLASAHGAGLDDLQKRPLYREIGGMFRRIVIIRQAAEGRVYEVTEC